MVSNATPVSNLLFTYPVTPFGRRNHEIMMMIIVTIMTVINKQFIENLATTIVDTSIKAKYLTIKIP